jgi:hypothetical protein
MMMMMMMTRGHMSGWRQIEDTSYKVNKVKSPFVFLGRILDGHLLFYFDCRSTFSMNLK